MILAFFLGYALGCLNTGYYLIRLRRSQDIRTLGSGTAGATNAGRILGTWGFIVVFIVDFCKGVLAALLGRSLVWGDPGILAASIGVVAGHIWPAQLSFRGGKGVASALGAAPVMLILSCGSSVGIIGAIVIVLMVMFAHRNHVWAA